MILTVTLNAALDVTYRVDRLEPETSHRVRAVHERAGGKGINVARVLRAQGRDVSCMGLVGGSTGARIIADLDGAGIPEALTTVAGESRRTVSVVSTATGGSTMFNEPGPHIREAEWRDFLATFARSLRHARVVVLSGSLPPGLPDDTYADLSRVAHGSGVSVIVDADGAALQRALVGSPEVVKPNSAELHAATGVEDAELAMRALLDAGAGTVIATFGPQGIRALTQQERWTAHLDVPVAEVNPTGAGDAVAAAIAAGLEDGRDWMGILTDAVAWSAAAVAAPVAGDLDGDVLRSVRSSVRVEAG